MIHVPRHKALCISAWIALIAMPAAADVSFDSIGYPQGKTTHDEDWLFIQAKARERIQWVSAPRYKNLPQVMQVMVQPGDNVGGWGGERSEVAVMRDSSGTPMFESLTSGTQYFAFSILIPEGWHSPEHDPICEGCLWGAVLQLHGPDAFGASPTFAFNATDHFSVSLDGGDLDALGKNHGQEYAFTDGGNFTHTWDDFVVRITFSWSKRGNVTVWRRKSDEIKFTQVMDAQNVETLQVMPSVESSQAFETSKQKGFTHEYWKQGYYRSTSPHVTSLLYETGLVRADSFADSEKAAFGTKSGF